MPTELKTTQEISDAFLASEIKVEDYAAEMAARRELFEVQFALRTNSEGDQVEFLKVGNWVTNFLKTGQEIQGDSYVLFCVDTYTSTQITIKSENGFRWLMDSGSIDDKQIRSVGEFIDDLERKQIRVYKHISV